LASKNNLDSVGDRDQDNIGSNLKNIIEKQNQIGNIDPFVVLKQMMENSSLMNMGSSSLTASDSNYQNY
jgi:hypothetical protein